MSVDIKTVRDRLHFYFYLSPEVAAIAGLSLEQLRQIIGGTFTPNGCI